MSNSDSGDDLVTERVEDAEVGQQFAVNAATAQQVQGTSSVRSDNPPANQDGDDSDSSADLGSLTCQQYFQRHDKNKAILLTMCLGLESADGKRLLGDPTSPPYDDLKPRTKWRPTNPMLVREVLRRCKASPSQKKPVRCSNWAGKKLVEWLSKNPVTAPLDVDWLKRTESAMYDACLRAAAEKKKLQGQTQGDKMASWTDDLPYLWMYCCAVHDDVRETLVRSQDVLDRAQLDARNSVVAPPAFYEALKDKYNDESFIPTTRKLPDLYETFASPIVLPLDEMPGPVTTDFIKKKWNDSKMKLTKVIDRWERSGNGFGQLDDDASEQDANEPATFGHVTAGRLLAGDNRSEFVWPHLQEGFHLLYLWNEADKLDILQYCIVALSDVVAATGEKVDTSTAKPATKRTKTEEDQFRKLTASSMHPSHCGEPSTCKGELQPIPD